MAFIEWNDYLSIQVDEIDEQHKKLVGMVNELHDAMRVGRGKDITSKILDELVEYTKVHFESEEKFMQKIGYPNLKTHKEKHDKLTAQVVDLQDKVKNGKAFITLEVMTFLGDWLNHHIMEEDKKIGDFQMKKTLR